MRVNRVVRTFDWAVLALMAARRRRRRAAELDSAFGWPESVGRRAALGGSVAELARGKRRRTALAATAALASGVLTVSVLTQPAPQPVPPWADEHVELLAQELDPGLPGWLKHDLREQQRLNALRAVRALAAENPQGSRDVRRAVARCDRTEYLGADTIPACDEARDDAIRAGRALFGDR